MYEAYYKFEEAPFSLLPDPGFLYLGSKHAAALAVLQYGLVSGAPITLVTGGIGCGKTTLVRKLIRGLDGETVVGMVANTHQAFGSLLQWVALAFGVDYRRRGKTELYEHFVAFLEAQHAVRRRVLLIVDEAQNLGPRTLEELRILSNVNADMDQRLQLVVVGQPELRDTLRRPDLTQFAQRIGVEYHLNPLATEEVGDYIRHRLGVAGGAPDLFTPAATELLAAHSGGVPRVINTLCNLALVYGFARQETVIDLPVVSEVIRDRMEFGTLPAPSDRPSSVSGLTGA